MLRARAALAPHGDGADHAAEEVAGGLDLAPAGQRLLGHWAIVIVRWCGVRRCENEAVPDSNDPAVLWRLRRGRSTAHATIFPGGAQTTLTWFFDGVMDRAENYDSVDLALARAEHIRGMLLRDGWTARDEEH